MSNFHTLEVVCRGSETQLQVGKNDIFECSVLRADIIKQKIQYGGCQFFINRHIFRHFKLEIVLTILAQNDQSH